MVSARKLKNQLCFIVLSLKGKALKDSHSSVMLWGFIMGARNLVGYVCWVSYYWWWDFYRRVGI